MHIALANNWAAHGKTHVLISQTDLAVIGCGALPVLVLAGLAPGVRILHLRFKIFGFCLGAEEGLLIPLRLYTGKQLKKERPHCVRAPPEPAITRLTMPCKAIISHLALRFDDHGVCFDRPVLDLGDIEQRAAVWSQFRLGTGTLACRLGPRPDGGSVNLAHCGGPK
jgi:hypothetical protein